VEEDTIARGALAPGEKPAQILICRKRKKRRQESLAFLVEFVEMDSPFQLSITEGLLTPQLAGRWFTKDPVTRSARF
jgi:hypothetical protein